MLWQNILLVPNTNVLAEDFFRLRSVIISMIWFRLSSRRPELVTRLVTWDFYFFHRIKILIAIWTHSSWLQASLPIQWDASEISLCHSACRLFEWHHQSFFGFRWAGKLDRGQKWTSGTDDPCILLANPRNVLISLLSSNRIPGFGHRHYLRLT